MMFLNQAESAEKSVGAHRCWTCGRNVSPTFARVFGDNQNEVYGCPGCSTFRELSGGIVSTRSDRADD
jgi:hypothetical protein